MPNIKKLLTWKFYVAAGLVGGAIIGLLALNFRQTYQEKQAASTASGSTLSSDAQTGTTPGSSTNKKSGQSSSANPNQSAQQNGTSPAPSGDSSTGSSNASVVTAGIWKPTADKPLNFHWVLENPLNLDNAVQMGLRDFSGNVLPAPDVYDIDGEVNSASTVSQLHAMGKKVICYFDAGVYETYRSDAYKFQALSPRIWGNADEGWDNSYWLDIRRIDELKPIMQARMQMCKDKGFDAIEPDEIDGWENDSGFPLTYQDQINYNKKIAQWAHEIGLSIGLKGDLIQAHDLVNDFDWTLNEECFQYNECTNVYNPADDKDYPGLQVFVQQNKAVIIAEYSLSNNKFNTSCATSATQKFSTYMFKLGLPNNGGRKPCPASIASSW